MLCSADGSGPHMVQPWFGKWPQTKAPNLNQEAQQLMVDYLSQIS